MSDVPPHMRRQYKLDADHLKWLAIAHFGAAAFALLGIVGLVFQYSIMERMFTDPNFPPNAHGKPMPESFMMMFEVIFTVMGVIFAIAGLANLLSGFFIKSRTNRMFSLIVAACNCLQIPMGTALGIFTFIVLQRESVRNLYESTDIQ